jgi:hypothetical protein
MIKLNRVWHYKMNCERGYATANGWKCHQSATKNKSHSHTCGSKMIFFHDEDHSPAVCSTGDMMLTWNEYGVITSELILKDRCSVATLNTKVGVQWEDDTYQEIPPNESERYRCVIKRLPYPIAQEIFECNPLFGWKEWQKTAGQIYPRHEFVRSVLDQ